MLNRHGLKSFCFAITPEISIYPLINHICKKWFWFEYWLLASPKNLAASIQGSNKKSFSKKQNFHMVLIFIILKFYVHVSVHREATLIIVQQDATIYSLLYFCKLL